MFLCACQELAISIADHWKSRTECDHCRQILDCFVFPSDVKANPSSICTEIHVDNSCRHKAQTHQNIGKHVRQKSDRTHAPTYTHPPTDRQIQLLTWSTQQSRTQNRKEKDGFSKNKKDETNCLAYTRNGKEKLLRDFYELFCLKT